MKIKEKEAGNGPFLKNNYTIVVLSKKKCIRPGRMTS